MRLDNVPKGAVVSALRGFSAPVVMSTDRTDAQLAHLVQHDSDGFSRWDACQTLFANEIARRAADLTTSPGAGTLPESAQSLTDLMGVLLDQAIASAMAPEGETVSSQQALLAKLLTLPAETDLFERQRPVDVLPLLAARTALATDIATEHLAKWTELYEALGARTPYSPDAASIAHRALRNRALAGVALGAPVCLLYTSPSPRDRG